MAIQLLHRRPDPFRGTTLRQHRVKHARVIGLCWHVVCQNDRVLLNLRVAHKKFVRKRTLRRPDPIPMEVPDALAKVAGPAVLIGGHHGYYHHLLDYLANMMYWESNPRLRDFPAIISDSTEPFQDEMLRHLGIPEHRLIKVPAMQAIDCSELFMVPYAFVKHSRVLDNSVFPWLRSRFAPAPSWRGWLRRFSSGRRIYISRQRARSRRLRNSEAVRALLAAHGFEEVFLESLPFKEQVALLSSASAVVGVHGSGLTNIVFAQPGTSVIEIVPADLPPGADGCFSNLAPGAGLKHTFVGGTAGYAAAEFDASLDDLRRSLRAL